MDALFSYSDLEFAQITKAQDQNTFIDHKQSLCQMFSFESFFRYIGYGQNRNHALFQTMTLSLHT